MRGAGRLAGRTALVTGGSSGLGFGIVALFLREGARVLFTGRDAARGQAAEKALSTIGECSFLRAEASSGADAEAAAERIAASWGGLDVLVNNAGVGLAAPLSRTSEADWDRIMNVNVKGYYLYARALLPALTASGGSMVHIGSDAGIAGEAGYGVYSVSKAAVIMLSKLFAVECGPVGVRSNCVCPGDIVPGMRHMMTEAGAERPPDHWHGWPVPPVGRYGATDDVARAVLFLASDDSTFCNGSVLLVDGGMHAGIPVSGRE